MSARPWRSGCRSGKITTMRRRQMLEVDKPAVEEEKEEERRREEGGSFSLAIIIIISLYFMSQVGCPMFVFDFIIIIFH